MIVGKHVRFWDIINHRTQSYPHHLSTQAKQLLLLSQLQMHQHYVCNACNVIQLNPWGNYQMNCRIEHCCWENMISWCTRGDIGFWLNLFYVLIWWWCCPLSTDGSILFNPNNETVCGRLIYSTLCCMCLFKWRVCIANVQWQIRWWHWWTRLYHTLGSISAIAVRHCGSVTVWFSALNARQTLPMAIIEPFRAFKSVPVLIGINVGRTR